MAIRFDRSGHLVQHGDADRLGRPDAVEFQARSGQADVDWLAEIYVWMDRWPTREGVAVLLERAGAEWVPCAYAMPIDGIYITTEGELQIVFSVYVPLTPGATYRLQCPGAVLTRETIRIGAAHRHMATADKRLRPRLVKTPAAPARRAS